MNSGESSGIVLLKRVRNFTFQPLWRGYQHVTVNWSPENTTIPALYLYIELGNCVLKKGTLQVHCCLSAILFSGQEKRRCTVLWIKEVTLLVN